MRSAYAAFSAVVAVGAIVVTEGVVESLKPYGAFVNLDELLKVDGIGTKTLVKLKERLICLP